MKILTISIAAYNVEAYIEQCLNTFADKRLNETLEVLIINDGSTDGTVQICERYVRQYPEIFRLINKENGGHGSTINMGIREATGKYYRPVDGDDWIDTENLIVVIGKLMNVDSDLIITDYVHYQMEVGLLPVRNFKFLPKEQNLLFNDIILKEPIIFHNSIYKTNLLKKNNIFISEKVFYDDTEYSLYPMQFVNSFFYIPMVLYYYRLGRQGQSVSIENLIKNRNDLRQIIKKSFLFFNVNKQKQSMKSYYRIRIHDVLNLYFNMTLSDLWISAGKKMTKENQLFYKGLLFISPCLFLSFMAKDKIRWVMLITWFSCDVQLLSSQKKWCYLKNRYLKSNLVLKGIVTMINNIRKEKK